MLIKKKLILVLPLMLLTRVVLSWQDDVEVFLPDPLSLFSNNKDFGFVDKASSRVRLGRYLAADKFHAWRGGVEGVVSLFKYLDGLFFLGLNMETLADQQNEIYFRLVQLYYQALAGIKWRFSNSVITAGYSHRCSHGADRATNSRITIRSGFTSTFGFWFTFDKFRLDVVPGINVYLVGQNKDELMQPKGSAFLSAQALFPIIHPFYFIMAGGLNFEWVGQGQDFVYTLTDKMTSSFIETLSAFRVALRFDKAKIKNDYGFVFAQYLDTAIGKRAKKLNTLTFNINFMW